VSTTFKALESGQADLWDSGVVESGRQAGIAYAGKPLASAQQVFWRVKTLDLQGRESAWSDIATWSMGVLAAADWAQARWITDSELLKWHRTRLGFQTRTTFSPETTKWVTVDLGSKMPIDAIRLHAVRYAVAERYGFPVRFKVEASDSVDFAHPTLVADYTGKDYNQWATSVSLRDLKLTARYVRVTATRLRAEDDGTARFALSQIEVQSKGKNIAKGARVLPCEAVEDALWSATALTDGLDVTGSNPLANSTLLLRREFTVRPALRRAVAFVCGLGTYEFTLNGQRVGSALQGPAWTRYDKRVSYDSYDITAQLKSGENAAGLSLAGGFYNIQPSGRYLKLSTPFRPLTAIALLRLEYADGRVETVGTDASWKAARGPITYANMFGGEDYDARKEPRGWNRAGFKANAWRSAAIHTGPGGKLSGSSLSSPQIRAFETLKPAAEKRLSLGVTVYDLGQNAAIVLRLSVKGAAGTTVKVIPAELLKDDGRVDRGSAGGGDASWNYTLSGAPKGENWAPNFFYHGSRYLQVELGAPKGTALPTVESIEGAVIQSDSPVAGDFDCSNPLFNRIRTLVRCAQRANAMHVFSDCPHRERLGWIEQYYLNGPALRAEFDFTRLFRKCFVDMVDSQTQQGLVTSINPEYVIFNGGFRDSPEWGSALILAAWQHLEWTGDEETLLRLYPAMQRYLTYLDTKAKDNLLSHGLGDWYDLGPKRPGTAQLTPIPLTATAIYFADADTLSRIAQRLGKQEDAARYAAKAQAIREAFNRAFFNPQKGSYATHSQTSNALPLALGLVPDAARAAVLAATISDIRARGNSFTSGDVGYRYLLRALAEGGRSDVIFAMNNQSEKPGYGYQLEHGCTSLAEAWTAERSSSQNHFMLGQITEWLYCDLAGIKPMAEAPGFSRFSVAPQIVDGMDWVRATHASPRGLIKVYWKNQDGRLLLELSVPPNTTAEVRLPGTSPQAVLESGQPAVGQSGVKLLRTDASTMTFAAGSGSYRFEAPLAPFALQAQPR
jgi:hypothetical protein